MVQYSLAHYLFTDIWRVTSAHHRRRQINTQKHSDTLPTRTQTLAPHISVTRCTAAPGIYSQEPTLAPCVLLPSHTVITTVAWHNNRDWSIQRQRSARVNSPPEVAGCRKAQKHPNWQDMGQRIPLKHLPAPGHRALLVRQCQRCSRSLPASACPYMLDPSLCSGPCGLSQSRLAWLHASACAVALLAAAAT
jgi:hypothetical protein